MGRLGGEIYLYIDMGRLPYYRLSEYLAKNMIKSLCGISDGLKFQIELISWIETYL